MVNPIYLFFASKAGGAAIVLRLTVAGFLLFDAVIMTMALLSPAAGASPALAWDWLLPGTGVGGVILRWAAGLGLLAGLFTRFISLVLVVMLVFAGFRMMSADPDAVREVILAGALCLALMFAGGGAFSMDRKISDYLLPSFR